MNKLIAFTGPMGSGKTVAAEVCREQHKGVVLSFATPMKKCLKDLFNFEHNQLYTLDGKNSVDKRYGVSPRTIMQKFGTEFIRNTVPDLWVKLMEERIWHYRRDQNVFIDDCRFEDEAALIRRLGGTIVHIRGRCACESDHKSESGLHGMSSDITIINSTDLISYKEAVLEMVDKYAEFGVQNVAVDHCPYCDSVAKSAEDQDIGECSLSFTLGNDALCSFAGTLSGSTKSFNGEDNE